MPQFTEYVLFDSHYFQVFLVAEKLYSHNALQAYFGFNNDNLAESWLTNVTSTIIN